MDKSSGYPEENLFEAINLGFLYLTFNRGASNGLSFMIRAKADL